MRSNTDIKALLSLLFKPHPWHGVAPGRSVPELLNVYIEILPTDTVKYEIDKPSGILKIDRPQKYSNFCPTLYGFIPQTYCGVKVGQYCDKQTGRTGIIGDGDPLDICVLSERAILHNGILVEAIPIGGLRLIDGQEADDKIIAVLKGDAVYGEWRDIGDCPKTLIDRLCHYFLTYKDLPGADSPKVEITDIYSRIQAQEVIGAAITDYKQEYGNPNHRLPQLRSLLIDEVSDELNKEQH
jgi:inorganic pyrophosphatase